MIVQRRYHGGCGRMMVRNAGLLFLFIIVFKLSNQLSFADNTEMPDAMDLIFQTALEYGKSGAVSIMDATMASC
jgi:hypothetical protein